MTYPKRSYQREEGHSTRQVSIPVAAFAFKCWGSACWPSGVKGRGWMWYREDYLLGLITNGPSRAQWQKIERLDLRKYFDCVLVSGDLPWEKPDQNIFLEACKLLGVEARTCIMVGDKLETDIKVTFMRFSHLNLHL